MQGIKCCLNCVAPKRHPGCHGTCLKYREAKDRIDKIKAKKEAERRKEDLVCSVLKSSRG